MTDRFDNIARTLADPAAVERRGMLGRAFAALGVGAVAAVAGADKAGAAPKPPTVNCPPGLTLCGSVCRDLSGHNSHCGACGNPCANDAVCRNGTCVTVACVCEPTCPAGQTWCGGACRDLQTDAGNCGACGTTCPSGQVCSGGACSCPAGLTMCDGECIDISSDPQNCGGCGSTCAAGEACTDGVCSATCVPSTCVQQGRNCGMTSDGCGSMIDCGSCNAPMICGGSGRPGVCGTPS